MWLKCLGIFSFLVKLLWLWFWRNHCALVVCRFCPRSIATIEGLTRIQLRQQTVLSAWLQLISPSVLMIAWYGIWSFVVLLPYLVLDSLQIAFSLTGDSMRSFFSFRLFTTVDGYQNGMPNLPATTTTSLGRLFHFHLYYIGIDWRCPTVNYGNHLIQTWGILTIRLRFLLRVLLTCELKSLHFTSLGHCKTHLIKGYSTKLRLAPSNQLKQIEQQVKGTPAWDFPFPFCVLCSICNTNFHVISRWQIIPFSLVHNDSRSSTSISFFIKFHTSVDFYARTILFLFCFLSILTLGLCKFHPSFALSI